MIFKNCFSLNALVKSLERLCLCLILLPIYFEYLSEGGYLHPSLLAGKVQQIEKEREASPVVAVDESHPLFKIIEGRKEAERLQKQKQLEAVQAKKEQNSTQITVPPPDISQTVKWTAHHLGKVHKNELV